MDLLKNPIVVYVAGKLSTSPEFLEETHMNYAMVRGDVMGDSSMRFLMGIFETSYYDYLPLSFRGDKIKIMLTIFHDDNTINLLFSHNEDPESIWSWVESHVLVPKIRERFKQSYKSITDHFWH